MRSFAYSAVLLAGVAAAASPALAQPAVVSAPGTGLRVEGLVGYDMPKDAPNGAVYGGAVGYDFTAGGATVGVDAEYTDTDSDTCNEDVFASGDKLCSGLGRDLYVGARVGKQLGTSSFIYAKAGYTNQRVRTDYDDGAGGAGDFDRGQNLDGVRVGAGIELGVPTIGFGSAAFVKAEYRYSNYEQGLEKHQVLGGVGVRF